MNTVTLYHGTSSVNLSCILTIGLAPGHAKGGDAWAAEHHWRVARESAHRAASVFLADDPDDAVNFAELAVEEMGGKPILVVLHIPEDVFETFVVDELFDARGKPHAWRAPRVDAAYVAEVRPVQAKRSDYQLMSTLTSLLEVIRR